MLNLSFDGRGGVECVHISKEPFRHPCKFRNLAIFYHAKNPKSLLFLYIFTYLKKLDTFNPPSLPSDIRVKKDPISSKVNCGVVEYDIRACISIISGSAREIEGIPVETAKYRQMLNNEMCSVRIVKFRLWVFLRNKFLTVLLLVMYFYLLRKKDYKKT